MEIVVETEAATARSQSVALAVRACLSSVGPSSSRGSLGGASAKGLGLGWDDSIRPWLGVGMDMVRCATGLVAANAALRTSLCSCIHLK